MTQDEADKIAAIIRTADNGCSHCVDKLLERLNAAGLGFVFSYEGEITIVEQPEWTDDLDWAVTMTCPNVTAAPAAP
jgi:hypothetical protein